MRKTVLIILALLIFICTPLLSQTNDCEQAYVKAMTAQTNDEKARLKVLLNYWIEHNKEHSQEFREWADRAKELGAVEASEKILQATMEMEKAGALLSWALVAIEEH